MQLERHHDKLTVRDETVVAHPDGSTVDVMETYGSVKLLGEMHIRVLDCRGKKLDLREGPDVIINELRHYGWIDDRGCREPTLIHYPPGTRITLDRAPATASA